MEDGTLKVVAAFLSPGEKKKINARVNDDEYKMLKAISWQYGVSMSAAIRACIRYFYEEFVKKESE